MTPMKCGSQNLQAALRTPLTLPFLMCHPQHDPRDHPHARSSL